ncbi:hypothetical protein Tco_0617881 [Tanacetum coccineum]
MQRLQHHQKLNSSSLHDLSDRIYRCEDAESNSFLHVPRRKVILRICLESENLVSMELLLPAEYAVWMGEIKALSHFKGIEKFETDLKTLHPILAECHVVKSKLELAVIQYANDISSEAHIEDVNDVRTLNVPIPYFVTFTNIEDSSVLHYGHAAAPNDRVC